MNCAYCEIEVCEEESDECDCGGTYCHDCLDPDNHDCELGPATRREHRRWERLSEGNFLALKRKVYSPAECLRRALKVIEAVEPDGDFHAEHDILYLPCSADNAAKLSDEDVVYLAKLGVMFDTEGDCLAIFC